MCWGSCSWKALQVSNLMCWQHARINETKTFLLSSQFCADYYAEIIFHADVRYNKMDFWQDWQYWWGSSKSSLSIGLSFWLDRPLLTVSRCYTGPLCNPICSSFQLRCPRSSRTWNPNTEDTFFSALGGIPQKHSISYKNCLHFFSNKNKKHFEALLRLDIRTITH